MNTAEPCRVRGSAPFDTESELFTWPSAQLFLVHEQEQALLQEGAFTLLLAHHSRSAHLVVVEASVGDVRWPVGKDCLVTALPATHPAFIDRSFSFSLHLPASHEQLTYQLLLFHHDQLAFPASCVHQINRLEGLLSLYATFHSQQQKQRPVSNPGPVNSSSMRELEEAAGSYWIARADDRDVGSVKQPTAGVCKEEVERENFELTGGVRSLGSSSATTTSPPGVSIRMMKRMQKARRISAVSKLFCKAVVRGLINAEAHIVQDGAENESESDEQMISTPHHTMEGLIDVKPVVANVDAITKVVEAVEGGMSKSMKRPTRNAARTHAECKTVLDISALTTWTINELGLRLVLNAAMAKSMAQTASISAPENLHNSTCTSARRLHPRPPRPPRRVNFVLNEEFPSDQKDSNSQ